MNGYMNSPIIQVTLERENLGEPWVHKFKLVIYVHLTLLSFYFT